MEIRYAENRLFKGISPLILEEIDLSIEEIAFETDEIVFEEGDLGEHVYLILQGEIKISKEGRDGNQETLAQAGPGGFFGEMALLDGDVRSARITAAGPILLGRINREGLDRFVSYSSETARHFARLISGQLRTANSIFIEKLLQSERLSLLGTMMGSMVHDFRNPLATLEMLSYYLADQEDEKLVDLGRIAGDSIEQMKAMTQELLDFSRGKIHLELKTIVVQDLIKQLDEQILHKVEGSGVTVNRDVKFDGEFTVDRNRLLRLLQNIVKNSWESMHREGKLTLRISKIDQSLSIEVEDTGCGMPPEVLAKVYEPFVTHGKSSGTGLGMAIAKSVVEAHQGDILMESKVGKGTRTQIRIPITQPSEDNKGESG